MADQKQPTVTVKIENYKRPADADENLGDVPSSIDIQLKKSLSFTSDMLEIPKAFKVIFFDYEGSGFYENRKLLPKGYDYVYPKTLEELNALLRTKMFQILVFNYDVIPKAINQMSIEIKKKLPTTRMIIVCRAIAPDKALRHQKSSSGVDGYYQLPLDPAYLEVEFTRIHQLYRDELIKE